MQSNKLHFFCIRCAAWLLFLAWNWNCRGIPLIRWKWYRNEGTNGIYTFYRTWINSSCPCWLQMCTTSSLFNRYNLSACIKRHWIIESFAILLFLTSPGYLLLDNPSSSAQFATKILFSVGVGYCAGESAPFCNARIPLHGSNKIHQS